MQKTIFTIIASVLVTILILGGVFIFWQNNKEKSIKESLKQEVKKGVKEDDFKKSEFTKEETKKEDVAVKDETKNDWRDNEFVEDKKDTRILLDIRRNYLDLDKICEEKFNNDDPTSFVKYESKEKGVSFKIPFNKNWGSKKYKITAFLKSIPVPEMGNDFLVFGSVGANFEGSCNLEQPFNVEFSNQVDAQEIIATLNGFGDVSNIKSKKIGGVEIFEYTEPGMCGVSTVEVVGKKYNYKFISNCSTNPEKDFKLFEQIVETLDFI